jgi:uncharacterized protein (DUF697 family)
MSWLDTLEDIRTKDFTKTPIAERDKAAREVVNMASYACAMVAISPIPFSDAVLMLPVQSAMVMAVGHIYGRALTQADTKALVVELAATAGAGILARQGIKALLPVVGALLTIPAAFAANWAMGRVAMEYFRHPGLPKDQLRKVYEAAKREGGSLFSKERFDAFRRAAAAGPQPHEAPAAPPSEDASTAAENSRESPLAEFLAKDFTQRLETHQDVREAFDGIIHLDITGEGGGLWTVDLTRARDFIEAGHNGAPSLTVRATAGDFLAILQGAKNVQAALLKGELVLEPMDLDLAMKLGPLFRGPGPA